MEGLQFEACGQYRWLTKMHTGTGPLLLLLLLLDWIMDAVDCGWTAGIL